MKTNLLLAALALVAIFYFSCKKKNDLGDPNCAISVTNIAGSYIVSEAKYKSSAGATEIDYLDELINNMTCRRDDVLIFSVNGVLTIRDGTVKCTPEINETQAWTLTGTTLSIDGEESTVIGIDCQAGLLRLLYQNWDQQGDELRILLHKQ